MRKFLAVIGLGLALILALPAAAQDVCASGEIESPAGPAFPLCGLCWLGVTGDPFCGQDQLCTDAIDCSADTDCPSGYKCARDTCCGASPDFRSCIFAEDCMGCINPGSCGTFDVCVPPPPCDSVTDFPICNGDCPPGLECEPQTDGSMDCSCQVPMFVELEFFRADIVRRGVMVSWKTIVEVDNAGFRVLRETTRGGNKFVDFVSPQVIHPRGSDLNGAAYSFLDPSKLGPGRVGYYLEDIDLRGRVTRHGPVYPGGAAVGTETRRTPGTREMK